MSHTRSKHTIYIQRAARDTRSIETVDECTTAREARYLIGEYQLADRAAYYYASTRACADWRAAGRATTTGSAA